MVPTQRRRSASIEADFYLHPGDRISKPISSFNTKTTNVLLKITVPRRTGRKRKRGSEGEFLAFPQASSSSPPLLSDPNDAKVLFQSLQDKTDRYVVEAVGLVQHTHRFRRLPDFVWSTQKSSFMAKFKDHILPFEYPRLKEFKFDMSKGVQEDNDIPPPPLWTRHAVPFNLSFGRVPVTKDDLSSADLPSLDEMQILGRNKLFMVPFDAPTVPTAPSSSLPPESSLVPPLRNLIGAMRKIFSHRPIYTRRAAQNTIPADIWTAVSPNAVKHLWQYIGFLWVSGPWRDTVCAWGVDPRKDISMRRYQTVVFQVESDSKEPNAGRSKAKSRIDRHLAAKAEVRDGHLFNGKTMRLDGKLWQICDISDPLLRSLVDTDVLRDNCDIMSDGWYTNGTLAKIRVIMKAKVSAILAGEAIDEQLESELSRLQEKVPDILTEENRAEAIFEKGTATARMMKWAESLRTTAIRSGGDKVARGPETAKPKASLRAVANKKTAVYRQGRGRGGGGGRPRKKRGMERGEGHIGAGDEQEMIDPRLRDTTGETEDVDREAALKESGDDAESSDQETSSSNSNTESSDEESDDEDSETDDDNTSEDTDEEDGESNTSD